MDILEMIKSCESEILEFKENFSEKVIETLVAFANHKGWKIILWLKDNWKIVWVDIWKETVQNLLNEIKNKTAWNIIPDIDIYEIENKNIILINQLEYPIKPISLKWKYYKRKWNSNHLMTTSEISDEFLKTKNSSWDMFISKEHSIDDLDFDIIKKVIGKINTRKEYSEFDDPIIFLKKYWFIENNKPSYGALVLFAPKYSIHRTVQIWIFQEDLNLRDEFITKDSIIEQSHQMFDYIKKYINRNIIITDQIENIQKWEYPLVSIRELVMNCIIHRDYRWTHTQIRIFPDYIEFFNAGWLPSDISIDEFLKWERMSYIRNKQIVELFKDMWEIEKFGSGIRRNKKLIEKEWWKVEIKTDQYSFMIRVYSNKISHVDVTKNVTENVTENVTKKSRLDIIIDFINQDKFISTEKIAKSIWVDKRTILRDIKKLQGFWKLKRIWPNKWGYWENI